jgi:hypothetical protein
MAILVCFSPSQEFASLVDGLRRCNRLETPWGDRNQVTWSIDETKTPLNEIRDYLFDEGLTDVFSWVDADETIIVTPEQDA